MTAGPAGGRNGEIARRGCYGRGLVRRGDAVAAQPPRPPARPRGRRGPAGGGAGPPGGGGGAGAGPHPWAPGRGAKSAAPASGRHSTGVTAAIADAIDAGRLDIAPGRPLLVVESVDVESDGAPIVTSTARFAADRVELMVEY